MFFFCFYRMDIIDESNSLFIYSFENLSLVLVFHLLCDDNYNFWKKVVKMVLIGKNGPYWQK